MWAARDAYDAPAGHGIGFRHAMHGQGAVLKPQLHLRDQGDRVGERPAKVVELPEGDGIAGRSARVPVMVAVKNFTPLAAATESRCKAAILINGWHDQWLARLIFGQNNYTHKALESRDSSFVRKRVVFRTKRQIALLIF